MSEERLEKINSATPAMRSPSSIMSAPRDKKKAQRNFIIVAALAVSLALNIILAIVSFSKNATNKRLEKDVQDDETLIIELKDKINALDL